MTMFALVLLLANPHMPYGVGVFPPVRLYASEVECIAAKTAFRPMLDIKEFQDKMIAEGVVASSFLCVEVADRTKGSPKAATPPAPVKPAKKDPLGGQTPVLTRL